MKNRKSVSFKPIENDTNISSRLARVKRHLQTDLFSAYDKAFRSTYNPGIFVKENKFEVKKTIAQVLRRYCNNLTHTRNEIAYFIKFFEESNKANKQIDPVSKLDSLHAKPKHGDLGLILSAYEAEIQTIRNMLEHQLDEESSSATNNLSINRHYVSYIKGMQFIGSLSTKFNNFNSKDYPTPDYHLEQIAKLKDKINSSDRKQLDQSYNQITNLQYTQLESKLKDNISILRAKRVNLDVTNMLLAKKSDSIDHDKLLEIAIKKEIIKNFIDLISHEEKQFLFHWQVYAKVNHLKPHHGDNKLDEYMTSLIDTNLVNETENYYKYEGNEGYSLLLHLNHFKTYFNPELIPDDILLDNNELLAFFADVNKTYREQNCMKSYSALQHTRNWDIMFTFPDCKWEDVWKQFIEVNLMLPLRNVNKLLEQAKTGPLYPSGNEEDPVLFELINRVKITYDANAINKMQSDRNIQLPEASASIEPFAKSRTVKF